MKLPSFLYLIAALFAGLAVFDPAPAMAQTQTIVFVDASSSNTAAPSASNPGNAWGNTTAYKFLQSGLTRAVQLGPTSTNHITIRVRGFTAGTPVYYPDESSSSPGGTGQRFEHFELLTDVTIEGHYIGTVANPDARDPAYRTILSGDLDSDGALDNGNSYHVVIAPFLLDLNGNQTAHIDGCEIRGGNADQFGVNAVGGGVLDNGANLVYLRGCIISSNHAETEGGGIAGSHCTLRN
jgi:predicted outer membrane repeat protein